MELARIEQREFNAMREHVALLLANGWNITARLPLTLERKGRKGRKAVVRCGVLMSSQ